MKKFYYEVFLFGRDTEQFKYIPVNTRVKKYWWIKNKECLFKNNVWVFLFKYINRKCFYLVITTTI